MYWRRTILSLIAIFVLLVGPSVVMVQAAYVPSAMVTHTQSFDRAENNHTYVYAPGIENFMQNSFLEHEDDVDWERYNYQEDSWNEGSGSYSGPATREFYMGDGYNADWGMFGDDESLPAFYLFDTEDPESYLGRISSYNVFPLTLNEEHSLVAESGYIYIGTFNVTDEEFFHMTVTSHQDGVECNGLVYDSEFRYLTEWGLDDADIDVFPFKATGNGTYYVLFEFYAPDPAAVPFDFLIEPVVPDVLAFGDVVEGNLPGSEIIFDAETGNSWVFEQKRPNVHTYKFSTNSTDIGKLSVLFANLGGIVASYETRATITGCLFEDYWAFWDFIDYPSDVFYYTSFANETYYLTVQGLDNTDFTIFNQLVTLPELPLNEEFFIQNWQADRIVEPYYLSLGQDSVVRVNSTEWSSGFRWNFRTLKANGEFLSFTMNEGTSFEGASTYYLPAGEYLIEAHSQSSSASGLYEFNLGPILDGAGAVAVDVDRIIGMRVPVENMMFHRMNTTLMTQDNVTVDLDIDILNNYGDLDIWSMQQLGNRQSGTSWIEFGTNESSVMLGDATTFSEMFCDGYVVIAVAPYRIRNNTAGITNDLFGRTVDFNIEFYEDAETIVTESDSVALGSEFGWTNFTLYTPGDANELYALTITGAEGIWMNFTIYTEDVTAWSAVAYQDIDGCPQFLDWDNLDAMWAGNVVNGTFQFGGISGEILLVFDVDRDLVVNGTLSIGITPMAMNDLTYLSMPTYYSYGYVPGPVGLGIDPVLAIAGVGIIAVVVVVVVVVLKKRGTF
ncbi:MAG: hypothetical protein ACW98Y_13295 [Candidatus Thorarchaeota archaeon]|jgi:hypothetical protein